MWGFPEIVAKKEQSSPASFFSLGWGQKGQMQAGGGCDFTCGQSAGKLEWALRKSSLSVKKLCSPSPQSTLSALSLSRTFFPQRSSIWFPFGEQLPSHDLRSSWSTSCGQLGVLQGHPCWVRTPTMGVSGTHALYRCEGSF